MRKPSASARRTGRASSIVPSMPKDKGARAKPAKANGRSAAAPRPAARPAPARHAKPADRRPSEKVVHGNKAPAAVSGSRGKYVYCIIEASDPLRFGPIGIGADPSEVYSVHYRNLAAVVSDAPLEMLDLTRENVVAH